MTPSNICTAILLIAITCTGHVKAYLLPKEEIVWRQGMPIERAIQQLKERVSEALQQNTALQNPPVDVFPQFFRDMALIGRTTGRSAAYPLTGLEWNAWYAGEIARMRAHRQAYYRTVDEIHNEAAAMNPDRRQGRSSAISSLVAG
ncbi:uncharacterized protein UMAG_02852 [Mycosarcoma maydis]|uniref:Uncharacterized protein n=1 Tax=Mycosarcoma maydis TaxID=5270 RepID=A0A0D1DXF5_MYCMD|nr:uncharacterized protein UMAG_02852 [Ustilago maydis 521]KIS68864.1 hypothetical protein UMAG_02852 [Ustilago maydis 521]|eukprot:XP_011389289.1 hypothetical protein UMAG_02852 [Ustilago maydis 521]